MSALDEVRKELKDWLPPWTLALQKGDRVKFRVPWGDEMLNKFGVVETISWRKCVADIKVEHEDGTYQYFHVPLIEIKPVSRWGAIGSWRD